VDDLLCLLACLGWKPVWYREWWTRPPYATEVITPVSSTPDMSRY
jgi:hypothetical protein